MGKYSRELFVPASGRINVQRQEEQAKKYAAQGLATRMHYHGADDACVEECQDYLPEDNE